MLAGTSTTCRDSRAATWISCTATGSSVTRRSPARRSPPARSRSSRRPARRSSSSPRRRPPPRAPLAVARGRARRRRRLAMTAEAVARALVEFVERGIRIVVLEVHSNLVARTPKDTTWAASNWIPRVGAAQTTPVGRRGYAPGDVTFGPQGQGRDEVARYRLSHGDVFVSNNVPYIGSLNAGSSAQAPAGFVQLSIMEGIAQGLGKLGQG